MVVRLCLMGHERANRTADRGQDVVVAQTPRSRRLPVEVGAQSGFAGIEESLFALAEVEVAGNDQGRAPRKSHPFGSDESVELPCRAPELGAALGNLEMMERETMQADHTHSAAAGHFDGHCK
jgi:hypothetical protein